MSKGQLLSFRICFSYIYYLIYFRLYYPGLHLVGWLLARCFLIVL
jgi:hypothetical protein